MKTANNLLLYVLLFVLTVFSSQVSAQSVVSANRVVASQELWVRTVKLDSISNDPNFIGNRATVGVTQQAVKAYVDSRISGAKYQIVQTGGTPVTQRGVLNFGANFVVTDNSGNNSSDVTLASTVNITTALNVPQIAGGTGVAGSLRIKSTTNAVKGGWVFFGDGYPGVGEDAYYNDSAKAFYFARGQLRIKYNTVTGAQEIGGGPSAYADNIAFGPSNRIFINSVLGVRDNIESANAGTPLSLFGMALNTGGGNSMIINLGKSGPFQGAGAVSQNGLLIYTPGQVSLTGPGAAFVAVYLQPTYNNITGSADTLRGFYYNPVLTSMTGIVIHDAFRSTSGDVSLGGGGHIKVGVLDSGASVNIRAGTTTVAPIKLTAGVLLTSPINGSIEFDGVNYYTTAGGVRSIIGGLPTPGANGGVLKVVGGVWAYALDSTYMRNGLSVSATGDTIKLGGQLNQTTNLHGQFDFVFDSLTSISFAHNTLANKLPVVTDSTIYRDAAGRLWTTVQPIVGQTTLVAGTRAITITGISTGSKIFVSLVSPSGASSTIMYQGVATTNTVTLQANIAAGTINSSDVSTVNYVVYP